MQYVRSITDFLSTARKPNVSHCRGCRNVHTFVSVSVYDLILILISVFPKLMLHANPLILQGYNECYTMNDLDSISSGGRYFLFVVTSKRSYSVVFVALFNKNLTRSPF
jgi:hypothetical protein